MGQQGRPRRVTLSIALLVALGVGANVAVVSILRYVIIGALPYPDVNRLVVLENRGAYDLGFRKVEAHEITWPDFEDLAAEQHVFSAIGGVTGAERTVWDTGTRIQSVQRVFVTRTLFQVLGANADIGRMLREADFDAGAPAVVLVTASLWRAQLGSDPGAVGRVVHVDGLPFTLVGVVDDGVIASSRERTTLFERRDDNQCLVVPIVPGSGGSRERLLALRRQSRHLPMLTAVARLKPGSSIEDAQREVHLIAQRLAQQYPDTNGARSTDAVLLKEWRTREVRYIIPLLLAVATLAWLAACASAAGLVLADAIRREPEMAVRHALGASRATLVRLLVRRSIGCTVPGGFLGLVLAWGVVTWIAPGSDQGSGRVHVFDPAFVAQAAGLTVLAGLAFGGIASWVLFQQNLALGLKEAAHTGLPSRRRRALLGLVITCQIAAATSLGLVCLLLIRSMVNVISVDVGFDTGQAFMVRVFLPEEAYRTADAQSAFFDRSLTQIRALPNVASAGISNTPPLSRVVVTSGGDYALEAPGRFPKALGPLTTQYVSVGYFESIGVRLSRGRVFSAEDARAGTPVIVVDEAFCRLHLGSADPLTAGIRMDGTLFRVVGVLQDVRPDGPIGDVLATLYFLRDNRQPRQGLAHFVVRPSRATPQLMDQVVRVLVAADHRVVVDEPQMLGTLLAETLGHRRRTLRILAFATAVVFMLTSFSISGALSEFVANKTRDLALRKALGASVPDTLLLLAAYVARPCIAGLIVGTVGGWWLARTLSGELFGIAPTDPAAMGATVVCVVLVGGLAAVGPLARAIRIDPAHALRAL
jgi:putative ABC transport system permease protein